MIRTKQPPRGAYDWMLNPIRDEVPRPHTPPPPPPEPPRRPQQIRIEIDIRQGAPQRPASGLPTLVGAIWAAIIAIGLLALLGCSTAHAQPTQWQSHRDGYLTRYQGTDRDGRTWTGQSYRQGFTTYTDVQGPQGRVQHCRSYRQGFNMITECY